jgi:hypothetical protein
MTLLEQFEHLRAEGINRFIAEGKEEGLHLEFKIANADLRRTEDKQNLARCLSGFANSDGGIIVWGVDARKVDGIDCATAPRLITPLPLFMSRLDELTGDATSPILEGVRHKPLATDEKVGFAATLVPVSVRAPHRAELGLGRYYKRSGASFREMEHFDLEDMFGRRQKPDLHLTASPGTSANLGDEREQVDFAIQNTGRALAKHVGFSARFENATIANVSGGPMQDVTKLNNGRAIASYENNQSVIHVGVTNNVGWVALKRLEKNKPVVVHVRWYCENMLSREETFRLPPATVTDAPAAR